MAVMADTAEILLDSGFAREDHELSARVQLATFDTAVTSLLVRRPDGVAIAKLYTTGRPLTIGDR
jgi:hypothetical protein